MAPAPSYIPIEVVRARVREHPHDERTPSGLVSWTERVERERVNEEIRGRPQWNQVKPSRTVQLSMRDGDEEMSRQNRKECDQILRTEAGNLSVFSERMVCL